MKYFDNSAINAVHYTCMFASAFVLSLPNNTVAQDRSGGSDGISPDRLSLALDNLGADPTGGQHETDSSFSFPTIDYGEHDDWLYENLRFTIDFSSRVSRSTTHEKTFTENVIGFDVHKVLSGPEGDWGTLVLQGYLTRIDNQAARPVFFEDEDDWEFVYRIFNFNYTGLSKGAFNVRVGHFEIPFGIEHLINTNGTLRDYIHGRNLGVKADWGVAVNGELPGFEYEVGLSRGTGNEYFDHGNPYILAGRIGTPRDQNVVFGLSGFYGEVANPTGPTDITRRTRFGVDAQWYHGPFGLLGEVSIGQNFKQDIVNSLVELNWRNQDERWLAYIQTRGFFQRTNTWDDALSTAVGFRFAPDNHWAISAQYSVDLTSFSNGSRDSIISAQVRYRF